PPDAQEERLALRDHPGPGLVEGVLGDVNLVRGVERVVREVRLRSSISLAKSISSLSESLVNNPGSVWATATRSQNQSGTLVSGSYLSRTSPAGSTVSPLTLGSTSGPERLRSAAIVVSDTTSSAFWPNNGAHHGRSEGAQLRRWTSCPLPRTHR